MHISHGGPWWCRCVSVAGGGLSSCSDHVCAFVRVLDACSFSLRFTSFDFDMARPDQWCLPQSKYEYPLQTMKDAFELRKATKSLIADEDLTIVQNLRRNCVEDALHLNQ